MRHRFIQRATKGKLKVKKSRTQLTNLGNGDTIANHVLLVTQVGDRIEGTSTIKESANNNNICNVGDMVKYINYCIQCGARDVTPEDEAQGWLEYGLVLQTETEVVPSNTTLGTQTLQDTLTKLFRNNCIFTGCIPIGGDQPFSVDLKFKIPKKWSTIRQGANWHVYSAFRSVQSTSVIPDIVRLVTSHIYQCYS